MPNLVVDKASLALGRSGKLFGQFCGEVIGHELVDKHQVDSLRAFATKEQTCSGELPGRSSNIGGAVDDSHGHWMEWAGQGSEPAIAKYIFQLPSLVNDEELRKNGCIWRGVRDAHGFGVVYLCKVLAEEDG